MIAEHIDTILLVTGAVTCLAGVGFLFPRMLLRILLSVEQPSASVLLIFRHWSLLIFLIGGLLVYAADSPAVRPAVLVVAIVEKFAIGVLVAVSPARSMRLALVAGGDAIMASIYLLYLLGR